MDGSLLGLHIEMPGMCFCTQDIVVSSAFTLLGCGCYMSVLKRGETYECWDSELVWA